MFLGMQVETSPQYEKASSYHTYPRIYLSLTAFLAVLYIYLAQRIQIVYIYSQP